MGLCSSKPHDESSRNFLQKKVGFYKKKKAQDIGGGGARAGERAELVAAVLQSRCIRESGVVDVESDIVPLAETVLEVHPLIASCGKGINFLEAVQDVLQIHQCLAPDRRVNQKHVRPLFFIDVADHLDEDVSRQYGNERH